MATPHVGRHRSLPYHRCPERHVIAEQCFYRGRASPDPDDASGTVLLLAYWFLPVWAIAGAARAFGLGQALAAPLFLIEWKRNGARGETVGPRGGRAPRAGT